MRGNAMPSKNAYDQAVYSPRAPDAQNDEEAVRLKELYALVQLGLGHALDPVTFRAIADRQAYMRREQKRLAALLNMKQLGPDSYMNQLVLILESWADDTRGLLGPEQFRAIFVDRDPGGIVDPETFLADQH
jgi:hypothetical protein